MAEQALVVTDTVNKNAFLAFLETLLPTLTEGSILVMDNWRAKHPEGSVHQGDDVRDLVDARVSGILCTQLVEKSSTEELGKPVEGFAPVPDWHGPFF